MGLVPRVIFVTSLPTSRLRSTLTASRNRILAVAKQRNADFSAAASVTRTTAGRTIKIPSRPLGLMAMTAFERRASFACRLLSPLPPAPLQSTSPLIKAATAGPGRR